MSDYVSQFTGQEIDQRLAKVSQLETDKQDVLVSGTNIKTINGQSVLGGGNIQVQAGDTDAVKYVAQTLTDAQKAQARANIDAASLEDINDMDFVTAASLPTASASTMGHIYLIGPDANNNYDRYFTQESGGAYSWVSLGSTQIDLSTYATKSELTQLEAEVNDVIPTVVEDGLYLVDSDDNIGYHFGVNGITGPTTIITALIMSLIETIFATTAEDGFYIVDENRNIGFMVNASGAHSANLVEY